MNGNERWKCYCWWTIMLSNESCIFRRPFVKQLALCYRTIVCHVCLSLCLSVALVYCGQTAEWIKMPLDMRVGLGPGSPPKGQSCQFLAHVCCGQTAGWIKMPLGREVGLSPGDVVFDGDPATPHGKGYSNPDFLPMSLVVKRSPISATTQLLLPLVTHKYKNVVVNPIIFSYVVGWQTVHWLQNLSQHVTGFQFKFREHLWQKYIL